MKVVQQRNRSNRGCLLLENTYPISVRLKTAGHRRRPQKNHRGILQFTEKYVFKSVDCGTLQLVLEVFVTRLCLDIM